MFVKILGNQTKFTDVRMQKVPIFPAAAMPISDWLVSVKAYLTATARPRWRAYKDGSWIPSALSPMTMLATTYPGCVAGVGIVLSPDIGRRRNIVALKLRVGQIWVARMRIWWRCWRQQLHRSSRGGSLRYGLILWH